MLTAATIWLINGLHSRPDDGWASRDLMCAVLPHTEDDSNLGVSFQEDEQEEDGEGSVPHAAFSLIFLHDVWLPPESTVPRMCIGRAINDYTHKFYFGLTFHDIVSDQLVSSLQTIFQLTESLWGKVEHHSISTRLDLICHCFDSGRFKVKPRRPLYLH